VKILVSGRQGQVSQSLAQRVPSFSDIELVFVGRPEVDLGVEGSLARAIEEASPDLIINAAAFTAVDRAETEEQTAYRINADAAGEGALAAARVGAPFIQLSTDYVFDGAPGRAWRETDPVAPANAYGRTKAEGEEQVMAANARNVVVRTSWVVSPMGHNFVKTMLRLANERDEIAVVDDQRGCPTSALDLTSALIEVGRRAMDNEAQGIYHLAGAGEASWADLAEHVFRCSAEHGGPSANVRRIATADFPTPAVRPANSVLDCTKARKELGIVLPPWQESVANIVQTLAKL
jgi:dTDP-4-dehydrorhamnose reductase